MGVQWSEKTNLYLLCTSSFVALRYPTAFKPAFIFHLPLSLFLFVCLCDCVCMCTCVCFCVCVCVCVYYVRGINVLISNFICTSTQRRLGCECMHTHCYFFSDKVVVLILYYAVNSTCSMGGIWLPGRRGDSTAL